jgi:hypothetical protein
MRVENLKIDTRSWDFVNNTNNLMLYFNYCENENCVIIEFREIFYKISRLIKYEKIIIKKSFEIENYICQLVDNTIEKILEKIDKTDYSLSGENYNDLTILLKSIILSILIWD